MEFEPTDREDPVRNPGRTFNPIHRSDLGDAARSELAATLSYQTLS
jgi:hypothetical protein